MIVKKGNFHLCVTWNGILTVYKNVINCQIVPKALLDWLIDFIGFYAVSSIIRYTNHIYDLNDFIVHKDEVSLKVKRMVLLLNCVKYFGTGHEADVKHWCPVLLLGNFTYSHHNGSFTSCGALNSDLSACPSWTTMAFNYAMCNTMQGFSGSIDIFWISRDDVVLWTWQSSFFYLD